MITLKHLNEDTSWLVACTFNDKQFNILIDPWLTGPQTDYWKLFSTQWHAKPSCVKHINELEVEIHAVIISHEWTDHCHKATLLEVDKDVPVYATEKATSIIKSWKHFASVYCIPLLKPNQNWTTTSINGLPPNLGVSRIASVESDFAYYHAAICIAYIEPARPGNEGENEGEADYRKKSAACVIYTPHGIPWGSLKSIDSNGITQISALLHGLHEMTNPKVLGGKLNLGGRNAVRVALKCKPKVWVGTHDEEKRASGLVAKVIKRKVWTVEEAMRAEGFEDLVGGEATFTNLATGEELTLP